jgi:hypothetical protein
MNLVVNQVKRGRSEYKSCVLVGMTIVTVQTGKPLYILNCFMMHQSIDTMERPFPQTDQAGNVAIGSIITNIEAFG